jgi:hypothetical protein
MVGTCRYICRRESWSEPGLVSPTRVEGLLGKAPD